MPPAKPYVIDSSPAPTLDEIKRFEAQNRIILPEQYVNFLRVSNGGQFNGPDASALVGGDPLFAVRFLYGLNAEFAYWDLQKAANDKTLLYPRLGAFLPVGCDYFGNEYCLRVSRANCFRFLRKKTSDVWLLDHETGELEWKLADSFDEFLANVRFDAESCQETSSVCKIVEEGRADELKALLSTNGVDFNETSKHGWNLLALAAWNRQPKICRLLLEAGFDVNQKDADGATALHLTTSVDVVDVLIEAGADVEAKTNDGETPLLRCLKWRYEPTAVELLKLGARLDGIDPKLIEENRYVARFLENSR